jgi:hypothetical protein
LTPEAYLVEPRNPRRIVKELMWPEFVWLDGCLFTKSLAKAHRKQMGAKRDFVRTECEYYSNHTHVFDYFHHAAGLDYDDDDPEVWDEPDYDETHPAYDVDHPDFVSAVHLGRAIAHLWFEKLGMDFPDIPVRVIYTKLDNPIVRFHVYRPDEGEFFDPESHEGEIADGTMMILARDVGGQPNKRIEQNARS